MQIPFARKTKLLVALSCLAAVVTISAVPAYADGPKLTPEQKVYAHAKEECTDHKATFTTFAPNSPALFACYRTKEELDKDDLEDLLYDCFRASQFRGSVGSFGAIKNSKGRVTGLECVTQF